MSLLLREAFISEDNLPDGIFLIPADTPIEESAQKARRALLRPDYPAVVIRRNYPGLAEIANRVFDLRKHHSDLYPLQTARKFAIFRNAAGRDFVTLVKAFLPDQSFDDIDVVHTKDRETGSHIDNLTQKDASANLDRGYLAGGVVVTQAVSFSGTGFYSPSSLEAAGIAPVHDIMLEWQFFAEAAEAHGVTPRYAAPGDIFLARQGNWGPSHPPGVHTWPACKQEDKRTAYCAIGVSKPVFS